MESVCLLVPPFNFSPLGGILLTADGVRFADELGHRDYVTGEMWKNKGPFRLVLNSKAGKEIEWHCKHYMGRGLMKHFKSGAELAKEMGVPVATLADTFAKYNAVATSKKDPYGKKFFRNTPFDVADNFWVAIVTPVLHFTMGGINIDEHSNVLSPNGAVPGLFAVYILFLCLLCASVAKLPEEFTELTDWVDRLSWPV